MIQLKPVLIPSQQPDAETEQTLLPNGILHPRFAQQKPGNGFWLACDRVLYARMRERRTYHAAGHL